MYAHRMTFSCAGTLNARYALLFQVLLSRNRIVQEPLHDEASTAPALKTRYSTKGCPRSNSFRSKMLPCFAGNHSVNVVFHTFLIFLSSAFRRAPILAPIPGTFGWCTSNPALAKSRRRASTNAPRTCRRRVG